MEKNSMLPSETSMLIIKKKKRDIDYVQIIDSKTRLLKNDSLIDQVA